MVMGTQGGRVAAGFVLLMIVLSDALSSGVGYYLRTAWGGLRLLTGRRSVQAVLGDPETAPELKRQLELATRARDFASAELALPDNKSYRTYKHLDRPWATWTVVVAPELSIEPLQWCFAVAGCVSYRGYFSRSRAEKFATKWQHKGYDVDVGGVRAYSTLGWFADPLLSTFMDLPDAELVGLIVHELAHQRIYVKGDTDFNESLASTVELVGVRRWLESESREALSRDFVASLERERAVADLVRDYRQRLAELYTGEFEDEDKRERKGVLLQEMREAYERMRDSWGGETSFDAWFDEGLDNARLASLAAYQDHVPAFCALLADCSDSMDCFFERVEALAQRSRLQREVSLERLAQTGSASDLCGID